MSGDIRELKIHLLEAFSGLEGEEDTGDGLNHIRGLIDKIRDSLSGPGQQPGPWEAFELNNAGEALDAGFPKLALIAAGKAVAVHQLSRAEYAFGFDAARNGLGGGIRGRMLAEAARELRADQKEAAGVLEDAEKQAARKLEILEKETAATLDQLQRDSAAALVKKDQAAAEELVKAQVAGLEGLKAREEKTIALQHEREQALQWMSGSYSSADSVHDLSSENSYIAISNAQETAALELKEHQERTAADLKESQLETARDLRKSAKLDAAGLKAAQRRTAVELSEAQTIRALRKEKSRKD